MARKRGGLAGVWDRNKGWLRYVAPAVVGAIPGLGVPAAMGLGAAMRGLDRPGRRGIGLDPMQAALGAAEGYGAGSLGASAAGKLGIGKAAGAAKAAGEQGARKTLTEKAKSVANYAFKENPKIGEYALQGLQANVPSYSDETERQQLELQRRQYEDMMEERRRRGQLLAPMWQDFMTGRQRQAASLPSWMNYG